MVGRSGAALERFALVTASALSRPALTCGIADSIVSNIAESGVDGYEATAWNGLLAPAATPKPIVEQLNKAVNEILAQPEVAKRLAADGADPGSGSAADFDKFIRAELEKWAAAVKTSGAVMN